MERYTFNTLVGAAYNHSTLNAMHKRMYPNPNFKGVEVNVSK